MEHEETRFIRPSEVRQSTGFGLPRDLLEKSRRRVRLVCLLVMVGAGSDLAVALFHVATHPTLLSEATFVGALPLTASLLTVVLSAALWIGASGRGLRDRALIRMVLVYEVLLCLLIAVANPLSFYRETGALPNLTWVTPLIILFPLIVPSPPRHTLIAALAAASTCPLGVLLLGIAGQIQPRPQDYVAAAISPAIAVVIAFYGSRVVYGLGIEVARARRMGSYELVHKIGSGGMGEVWRARHRLLARPAAVKLIRPALLGIEARNGTEEVVHRFEREAQTTAAMRSPHTIGLYDFGVADDGTFYYVMELLDGFDAETLVRRFGPVPPERVVHLLRQACHSLAEAHEAGLIHRDIKPANLFLCRYGRELDFVKVLDFGLVKKAERANGDPGLTAEHVVTGTPSYMAPEQVLGGDREDARSDLYAVGCVAYWLLTGHLVFEGTSTMEVLTHHVRTAPVPPSKRSGTPIPDEIDRVVLACLEKDPARRPPSADALCAMLSKCPVPIWSEMQAREWWTQHAPETAATNT